MGKQADRGVSSRRCRAILTAALVLCIFPAAVRSDDWPAWRGPAGTGVSAGSLSSIDWSSDRNVRWRVALPDRGNSTPIVNGDRVFVTQAIEAEHRRTVLCFNRDDGKLLWQSGVVWREPEPTNAQNPYCAASPATDGESIYAYFGSAGLFCYDLAGRERWRRDVGRVDSWQGSGSSPVVCGDLCILNAGPGTNALLVACDKRTGAVRWSVTPPRPGIAEPRASGKPATAPTANAPAASRPAAKAPADGGFDNAISSADPSGAGGYLGSWSTPIVLHNDGRDELIVVHPTCVRAYDPASGKTIWTCSGLPDQAFASPAVGEGVLVAAGHRAEGGTRFTAIRLAGAHGDVTATHRLWQTNAPKECVGSGVIAAGRFFCPTQFGSILCLDLATGKKQWEHRLAGRGPLSGSWSSLTLVGGKLLAMTQSGEVFVLEPGPAFHELADNTIGDEPTCASPAMAGGQLFLRTWKSLWCIGTR